MVPVRIDSAVPHLALFASKDIIQVNANYYESEGSGGRTQVASYRKISNNQCNYIGSSELDNLKILTI